MVKLSRTGAGLGKYILSPVAVIAMLALLTTAVAFAAAPAVSHGPKNPHASVVATDPVSESPEAEESDAPKASQGCNALHGNAPDVIAQLVANYPTKHPGKDVPPGLKKVADRLAACQEAAGITPEPTESAAGETAAPDATPTPVVVGDEGLPMQANVGIGVGKHVGKGH